QGPSQCRDRRPDQGGAVATGAASEERGDPFEIVVGTVGVSQGKNGKKNNSKRHGSSILNSGRTTYISPRDCLSIRPNDFTVKLLFDHIRVCIPDRVPECFHLVTNCPAFNNDLARSRTWRAPYSP